MNVDVLNPRQETPLTAHNEADDGANARTDAPAYDDVRGYDEAGRRTGADADTRAGGGAHAQADVRMGASPLSAHAPR